MNREEGMTKRSDIGHITAFLFGRLINRPQDHLFLMLLFKMKHIKSAEERAMLCYQKRRGKKPFDLKMRHGPQIVDSSKY